MPFTVGPSLAGALADTSHPVRTLSSVALWLAWAVGMLAACVPHPLSLTALRVIAPGATGLTVWASLRDHPSAVAVGWAVVVAAWVFSPAFGEWCVNGPAYPNERRHLLRSPGPAIGGALGIVVAWDVAVAGLCAGPLLLAARQWVVGAIVTILGWALAAIFLRSVHGLSRRWLVFVPAGVVVHDPVTLRDPVLFPRRMVTALGPAAPGNDSAVDLTQRAVGLALELRLGEPTTITLMKPGRRLGVQAEAHAVVITPTRPGAVLEEARDRRLPMAASP
jgi:hypothetical protein